MYQKDLIRSAWMSAGLYDENDSKLQQFLKLLDDPTQCWTEMTETCRRSYAAYKTKLIQPILDSNDTLVHLMVIRAAVTNEDEMALLERYVAASDPARHAVELKAVALKNVARLSEALKQKPHLPHEVRAILAAQGAEAAAAASAGAPAADPTTAPVSPAAPESAPVAAS